MSDDGSDDPVDLFDYEEIEDSVGIDDQWIEEEPRDLPSIRLDERPRRQKIEGLEDYQNKLRERHIDAVDNWIVARKGLGWGIFVLVAVWIAFVITIVALLGGCPGFELPEAVVVTLLATTTVNIVGLLYVVATHFMPADGQETNWPNADGERPKKSKKK